METNLLIAPSQNMMMVRSNEWKQDVEEAVLIREQPQKRSPFIESNTTEVTLDHLRNEPERALAPVRESGILRELHRRCDGGAAGF